MLFKKFADIDVFDIEVNAASPDEFIAAVKALEPTFGGINLEDIKAPECFYIEEKLREQMSIPVFHDDQHGTAIIAGAAFLNALEITDRRIEETKVVVSGAGAAAVACATLFKTLGIKPDRLILCDTQGVIHLGRDDLNPYKRRFAVDTKLRTLAEALQGADAFLGVSAPGVLTTDMLRGMADNPIIFALANPVPEILPEEVQRVRKDAIIATGRSDYPNQVNNVLGFPYIFRGALDVRATTINEDMKLAAVKAIAGLAKEQVPEEVMAVYKDTEHYIFGRDYLIPKPVDQRVLLRVAPAVAEAAMASGVARRMIDIDQYREQIERILGPTRRMVRSLRKEISVSKTVPSVVIPDGEDPRMIRAAKQVADESDIALVLLGDSQRILKKANDLGIKTLGSRITLVNPYFSEKKEAYTNRLFELRQRKGLSQSLAKEALKDPYYFAAVMVEMGDADALVAGVNRPYAAAVKPVLQIVGTQTNRIPAGIYMLVSEDRLLFFGDCTVNIAPSANDLAEIALSTVEIAKTYTLDPIRVAMLSYGSFGTSRHESARRVAEAVDLIRIKAPDLEVDGEMQADVAVNSQLRKEEFPFTTLGGDANILIFPSLDAANISYKLLKTIGGVQVIGPILAGIKKPANIVQRGASVAEIVNMIYVSAHQWVGSKAGAVRDLHSKERKS
jgi:malate dehydrogenase (oxaloacetate-decarboxylating)(NADP+)